MQFIQFGFVEESLQIPFLATCGLVWTFIISLFAGDAKKTYSSQDSETISVNQLIDMNDVKAMEQTIISNVNSGKISEGEEKEMLVR